MAVGRGAVDGRGAAGRRGIRDCSKSPSGYAALHKARWRRERYDNPLHRSLRRQLKPFVEAGLCYCAKPGCGRLIEPGEPWDLGHDEAGNHRGPEHRRCNRATNRPHDRKVSRKW